jgi:type I restriction enzyme S subunit
MRLENVCHISSGGTPSRGKSHFYGGDIPWAKISDIENSKNGILTETQEKITKEGLKSIGNRIFPKGTLLFAMYGSIGKVAITGQQLATNQAILGIRPKESNEIYLPYLKVWFESNKQKLINQGRGVALQNLSATIIRNLEVPLPIYSVQKNIANILGKAENLISQRKQSIALLDEFLKSTFFEMFGDPVRNEKGWRLLQISEYGKSRLGKMLDGKQIIGNNLKPYLRNSNVQWFGFKLDELLEMDFDEKDKLEFSLKYGDILMCEGGEIGRCAIWRAQLQDCYFQKAIHRIRLNKEIALPEYFVYMFQFYASIGGLKKYMGAATISHLTGENLKKLKLPIPSIELQSEFAQIVEKTETLKVQYQSSLQELENLYGSLSQRAFRGELNLKNEEEQVLMAAEPQGEYKKSSK